MVEFRVNYEQIEKVSDCDLMMVFKVGFACLANHSPFNNGEHGKNGANLGLIRTKEVIFCAPIKGTKLDSIAEIAFSPNTPRFLQITSEYRKFNHIRVWQELIFLKILEVENE